MGYNIGIGQGRLLKHMQWTDSYYARPRCITRKDAPAYGEPTDNTSQRWPSYTSWSNFVRFVGLEDLFFNRETGLMRNHPGCEPLTAAHKERIDAAYYMHKRKFPNSIPRMSDTGEVPETDYQLARLTWLKYWVDYALKHCKSPVFYNS